jgi:3'(2'), 5'-bisphosphate nucleotidase
LVSQVNLKTHSLSEQDIRYVKDLAEEAGRIAVEMRAGVMVREKSGPTDMVTAADLALSKLIVERLSSHFTKDVIVSEEDEVHADCTEKDRVWLIDPIDGTDNYINNDGQYSVMIGLLENFQPVFGWVYAPALDITYLGGPGYGAFKQLGNSALVAFEKELAPLSIENEARVLMGYRDRKSHPWVKEHPKVTLVKAGSIGLKVAKVLEEEADLFVHLSGKLKTWDTAGPVAIALGGFLEAGSLETDQLIFPTPEIRHETSIIVGRPGSLSWARKYLKQKFYDTKVQA